METALRSAFFAGIRSEEKEIVMAERIPFPFEYDSISTETEMLRLRRLIYHETVEFKWAMMERCMVVKRSSGRF